MRKVVKSVKKHSARGVKKSAQISAKKKPRGKPRGKPFKTGNETRFKPGQSGNPGGRPKLLGESYKQWLGTINAQGISNAEAVALAMGIQAMKGDVSAAREIRAATEGENVHLTLWQNELIDQIRAGHVTPEEVIEELGIDGARDLLIAAGQTALPGTAAETNSGA